LNYVWLASSKSKDAMSLRSLLTIRPASRTNIAALQQLLHQHPEQLDELVVIAPGSIRMRSSDE